MNDCIFCKVVRGEIPATIRYETDAVLAFDDIQPQGPTHVLVIPKRHIPNVASLASEPPSLSHALMTAIDSIASSAGICDNGFRVVANTGDDGGQTVHHLHFHLIGGRSMTWPPG